MNKKTIIDNALFEIHQKKFNAEMTAQNNYKNACKNNKDFLKADIALKEKIFELAKQDKKDDILIDKLKKARLFELKKLNLEEKDITPQYSCKICDDSGYLNGKKCKCLKKQIQLNLIKNSGLVSSANHTFEDSDEKILMNNELLKKAHNLGKMFVGKFPNTKTKNLIFIGEVGTGKTFLLECIANELLKKGFYVVYVTAFQLSNTMLKALSVSPFESETILSPLLDCELLIVDDLGTEPMIKNLSVANLFTILNEREINGKSTLISTNLSLEDIETRYGNRLFSRLFNKRTTRVVSFKGADLRINKE